MGDAFFNFLDSTESFLNRTHTDPALSHDENTMSVPPGSGNNDSSIATPIETWIADTTLTNFSFVTAPIMLAVGKIAVVKLARL